MSLAELRTSIKSICTLEKATRAMRALSISLHTSLKRDVLYQKKILTLLQNDNNKLYAPQNSKKLYIFVGSQRGLCGTYNNDIVKKIKEINARQEKNITLMIIGKKLAQKAAPHLSPHVIIMPLLKKNKIEEIKMLINRHISAESIDILSWVYSRSENLFSKVVVEHDMIIKKEIFCIDQKQESFMYGHFGELRVKKIIHEMHYAVMMRIIFLEALIAEQAARFISMDKACRNSQEMIRAKSIMLNKKRQYLINRELEDLTSCWKLF
jgi:F-type H+-transporting ATPase subunit gamma